MKKARRDGMLHDAFMFFAWNSDMKRHDLLQYVPAKSINELEEVKLHLAISCNELRNGNFTAQF